MSVVRLDCWEFNDWDGDFALTCCKGPEGCSTGMGPGGNVYAHVDRADGVLVIEDESGRESVRVEIPVRVVAELLRRAGATA